MRPIVVLVLALGLVAPVIGKASEAPHVDAPGITFSQALRAAEAGPRERGLREALKVRREGDARIRGLPGSPTINVYPGWRVTPDTEVGPQLQLQISQPFSLQGLGRARKSAAKAEREVLAVSADAARLERQLDVARVWLEDWSLRQQAEVLQHELNATDRWLDDLDRLVAAGEATRVELATANAWRTEVELEVLAIEGMVHHTGLRLAELIGDESAVGPIAAVGAPPAVDIDDAELRRLARSADDLPSVRGPRLAAAASRAREVEVRAEAGWALEVGAMAQLDQPGPALGVFGQVGLRVPLWGRNERARSAALGDAARLEGEGDDEARRVARSIRDALHELRHTAEQVEALHERLVPALDEVVALEQRSLRVGESTSRRVVEARRSSLAGHRRLAAAQGEHAWAELHVWLLLAALQADAGATAR